MTAKVTAKVVIVVIMLTSCNTIEDNAVDVDYQQQLDSLAGGSIDSAYRSIQEECNQKKAARVPHLVDSIIQAESIKNEL